MKYLNIEEAKLKAIGGLDTAKEISGQPQLWVKIYDKLVSKKDSINTFLGLALNQAEKIILTGAGTSAYIGNSVEGAMQRNTGITSISIPSTHLVSHPHDYLDRKTPTLVISLSLIHISEPTRRTPI